MTAKDKEIRDYIGDSVYYDEDGIMIWGEQKNGELQRLADVRGWGAIQQLFNNGKVIESEKAAKFQDNLGKWLADAINEKLQIQSAIDTAIKKEREEIIEHLLSEISRYMIFDGYGAPEDYCEGYEDAKKELVSMIEGLKQD